MPPLLERETPLAALTAYARAAASGSGQVVLVSGEAGVGKSALVEQVQADLPDVDVSARWFWGMCDGLSVPHPLGPLFDIAGGLGGELASLCHARAAREELFAALLRQIDSSGILSVVVIEDVHWADEGTIDLLRFLGRRLRNAATLLIATYRDDALTAAHPLRVALGELATQRSTRRIDLAPLSTDAVRTLSAGSGLDAAELHQLTGGNAFYVTEVIRAGTHTVPASARDAVLARAARLRPESREVLDAAALIGTRVEWRLLEAVTGGSNAISNAVADDLLTSGLLIDDGHRLRFRHEIARLAIEQSIARYRRGPAHARILSALQSLGIDDDTALAFHAEGAGDGPAVLRHAPAAGRRASALASHREAAAQFERALRFAQYADAATAAALYDAAADELSLIDRWQDAADAGERALALWRTAGDRLREGDTLVRLSRAMSRLCRGTEAIDASEAAIATLEPLGPGPELAAAYANLATRRMLDARHEDAIGLARRASVLAERLEVTDVLSDALNTEACASAGLGWDWADLMRRALETALAGRLPEQAGRAYSNMCSAHSGRRNFAEAERWLREGLAYCDEHDVGTWAAAVRGEQIGVLERTGRWDEAVELISRILNDPGASPGNRLCPTIRLGLIQARRGEPGAWECLDEAMRIADAAGTAHENTAVRLARAEAYWLGGDGESAANEIRLADTSSLDAWDGGAVQVWHHRLGSAVAARVNPAEPYQRQLAGDWAGAARLWSALGCPYDAALALLDATEEPPLREAFGVFQDLRAAPAARLVRRRMRALGIGAVPVGARRATRAHPLGLTRREHEVLGLIQAGQGNAEIAAELFISVKTVESHVSAILAKIDAPTRQDAALQAARRGLLATGEHDGLPGTRRPVP